MSFTVSGFGGGTIYYPEEVSEGTYGAVAISPGFISPQITIQWLGPYLASQGFVVITIDTLLLIDFPDRRGDELIAALEYLVGSSPTAVRDRIDPTRLAVIGHSMGGGATLEASETDPDMKAAVGLTPWNMETSWPENTTPTLLIGTTDDIIASVSSHAIPMYDGLSATTSKAYLELSGGGHLVPTTWNATIATCTAAWLKRYVDDDTRYSQFLAPGPEGDSGVADWRSENVS